MARVLILAGDATQQRTPLEALGTVLPFAVKALVAGVVIGVLLGWLMDRAHLAGWVTDQSARVAVLLAPLLTFTATVAIDGNGFVASFVCGIAFRYVHRLLKARRVHAGEHAATPQHLARALVAGRPVEQQRRPRVGELADRRHREVERAK